MIPPREVAANILQLLQADPRRYQNFGVYWYLVKALMKRYYTRENLYLLGDYVDETVVERMPKGLSVEQSLTAALNEYQMNFMTLLGADPVDPDGEAFALFDQDANL